MGKKNVLTSILLTVLILSTLAFGTNVYAATTTIGDNTESVTELNVKKEVLNVADNVNNTFTYTIVADSNNPATVTGLPSSLTITFNNVAPVSGVATQNATLNLANVTFSKLGDYKFKIKETASSNSSVYPIDNEKEYFMYVSVRNVLDGNNQPTGALIATLANQVKNNDTGAKTDILFETKPLTSLKITNTLTGDMADKEEYFKFLVDIKSSHSGAEFTISGQDATVTYNGATVTTSNVYTVGQANYVYLKHGQEVTIGLSGTTPQVDAGIECQVTEVDAADYNTHINSSTDDKKISALVNLSNDSTKNVFSFVNHKEATTLTGVFMNILPFLVLIALAVIGIYNIKKTNKK